MTEPNDEKESMTQIPMSDAEINGQLRSAQTLITIAIIGGPVSLLIGGVLLSIATTICAIVAMVKLRRVRAHVSPFPPLAQSLHTQAIIALVISIAALTLNTIAFAIALSAMLDAIQSGNMDALLESIYGANSEAANLFGGSEGSADGSSSGSSGSVWDS